MRQSRVSTDSAWPELQLAYCFLPEQTASHLPSPCPFKIGITLASPQPRFAQEISIQHLEDLKRKMPGIVLLEILVHSLLIYLNTPWTAEEIVGGFSSSVLLKTSLVEN